MKTFNVMWSLNYMHINYVICLFEHSWLIKHTSWHHIFLKYTYYDTPSSPLLRAMRAKIQDGRHVGKHDFASKVRYQWTRNSLILFHSIILYLWRIIATSTNAGWAECCTFEFGFSTWSLLPHPVLHRHDTMHIIDIDATGLSLNIGINTPSLHCHLYSVGSKERPSHCCTV